MIRGNRLKMLRLSKGLTQTELGNMMGVKKSTISSYEHEIREPSVETIISLMHIFAVSADYLIGTDHMINIVDNEQILTRSLTNEELIFLEELKKNNYIYSMILEDPKRISELVKTKIG